MRTNKAEAITMAEGTQTKNEGARSLTRHIDGIQGGQRTADLSDDFHVLLKDMYQTARTKSAKVKGKFVITLDVDMTADGEVQMTCHGTRSFKMPKPAPSNFFITKDHNLTTEHPRQTTLPIRELRAPRIRGEEDDDAEGGAH